MTDRQRPWRADELAPPGPRPATPVKTRAPPCHSLILMPMGPSPSMTLSQRTQLDPPPRRLRVLARPDVKAFARSGNQIADFQLPLRPRFDSATPASNISRVAGGILPALEWATRSGRAWPLEVASSPPVGDAPRQIADSGTKPKAEHKPDRSEHPKAPANVMPHPPLSVICWPILNRRAVFLSV